MNNLIITTLETGRTAKPELMRREFRAMGSHMLALLETNAPLAGMLLDSVSIWFEDWEQKLSRFRPDSELSLLNLRSGHRTDVSAEFWEVLQLALYAANETGGLVTPAVLNALVEAGYDRTFDALQVEQAAGRADAKPHSASVAQRTQVPDWQKIKTDTLTRTVLPPAGTRLDFGGIAKGWAADRAAQWLGRCGPALVDAGGDIAVSGPMLDGSAWPIGVADPAAPDMQIEVLGIRSGGVATSGRDYRRWVHEGRAAHHIIDPRTGEPATTDVLSATVVAPTAADAEVAAKTVLILGSECGLQWLDQRPSLAGLVVLEDGEVLHSCRFSNFIWR